MLQNIDGRTTDVLSLIKKLAYQAGTAEASNADFDGQVGPLIEQAIAGQLQPRTIRRSFTETRGVNTNWTVTVTFRMGNPEVIAGGGVGTVGLSSGGSGSITDQTSTSSTDSASATAGAKQGNAATGGTEVSGGATAGTSNTTADSQTTTATGTAGTSASINGNLVHYRAPLVADVTVQGAPDFSGSDYVNPAKWGWAGAAAILGDSGPQSDSSVVGSFEYFRSGGIAPTSPAAAPAPAQRRTWYEQQLGVTSDAAPLQAQAVDAVQFSRGGAQPLPAASRAAAEQHHGAALDGVNLIQGAQSDSYCDSMSAAAFCTPGANGGSDIFLHSALHPESPEGQFTLQHEIAHAVQNDRGQTSALNGLGGDEVQRASLERDADAHAAAVVGKRPERA